MKNQQQSSHWPSFGMGTVVLYIFQYFYILIHHQFVSVSNQVVIICNRVKQGHTAHTHMSKGKIYIPYQECLKKNNPETTTQVLEY